MSVRRGDVVTHSEAMGWGAGKVIDVTAQRVSIQFNDGITRKIACSHLQYLLPAEAALFLPVLETDAGAAPKTKASSTRKQKR